jgi:two-component system NtrC family sensor kinase
MGLRPRLAIWLLVPSVVVLAAYAWLRVDQESDARRAEFERRVAVASTGVHLAFERAISDDSLVDARRLAADLVTRHTDIVRVRLVDSSLHILIDQNLIKTDPGAPLELFREILRSGQSEGRSRRSGALALYSTLAPIRPRDGSPPGALEIVYLRGPLGRDLRSLTEQIAVQVGLVLLVLIGVGGVGLQRVVFQPLTDLTTATERVATGELESKVPVRHPDEFGRLAGSFNRMVERLRAARQGLELESARSAEVSARLVRTETMATAGRLCWSLAHELGTPLNIIAGRAELVLQELQPDDPKRDDVQIILAQVERISKVIRTALDPFQPHDCDLQSTPLDALLEGVLPLLRHLARSRGVTLDVSMPSNIPPVLADAGHLQHVIVNLVMSAVDVTPTGGRVSLRIEDRPPANVLLSVTDTGPGIPPDKLSSVFEPFVHARRSELGPVMSLAISQDLMKLQGTDIQVESSPDTGTTFSVSLPVAGGDQTVAGGDQT